MIDVSTGSQDEDVLTLRLHAAAREAAGRGALTTSAVSTNALRAQLVETFGDQMGRVLAVSTLLIDGTPIRPGTDAPIPGGATVEVLPPFAGG